MAYSLWLLPPPDKANTLGIAKRTVDTALNGPDFELHLTIAPAGTLALEEFRAVCTHALGGFRARQAPFEVRPLSYEAGETYFQSLYLTCDVSAPVLALRQLICHAAGLEHAPYLPHISLYYGEATRTAKDALIPALPAPPAPFTATRFAIASNEPDPQHWAVVGEV